MKSLFKSIEEKFYDKETPYLVIDLENVEEKYNILKHYLPFSEVYYAVKSNPHFEVLGLLNKLGSNFDIASIYELDRILSIGVCPDRISYGNTIKKSMDIKYFYDNGVRLFVTDSHEDLIKIAKNAPGSDIFFRLYLDNSGADWPLSKKFGTCSDNILSLVEEAKKMGLNPYGLSFHVGSQQKDIEQWDMALCLCKNIFDICKKNGYPLSMLNLGGGLPAQYLMKDHNNVNLYFSFIKKYLIKHFGKNLPRILIEPGRYMVAESGILVTSVILNTKKNDNDFYRWLYIDAGKFNGLIETLNECIKYPILTNRKGKKVEMIIAGPTCDSLDILYEDNKYLLSENLCEGDKVYFMSTGAYTSSYSSVEFNGFPPIKTYFLW